MQLPARVRNALVTALVAYLVKYLVDKGDLDDAIRLVDEYRDFLGDEYEKLRAILTVDAYVNSVNNLVKEMVAIAERGEKVPSFMVQGLANTIRSMLEYARRAGVDLGDIAEELRRLEYDAESSSLSRALNLVSEAREVGKKLEEISRRFSDALRRYVSLVNSGDYSGAYRIATDELTRLVAEAVRAVEAITNIPSCRSRTCSIIVDEAKRNIGVVKGAMEALRNVIDAFSALLALNAMMLEHARRLEELEKSGVSYASDEYRNAFERVVTDLLDAEERLRGARLAVRQLERYEFMREFAGRLEQLLGDIADELRRLEKELVDIAAHSDILWRYLVEVYRRRGLEPPERPPRPPPIEILDFLRDAAAFVQNMGDEMWRAFTSGRGGAAAVFAAGVFYFLSHMTRMVADLVPSMVHIGEEIGKAIGEAVSLHFGKALETLKNLGIEIVESMIPHGRNPAEIVADALAMITLAYALERILEPVRSVIRVRLARAAEVLGERIPIVAKISDIVRSVEDRLRSAVERIASRISEEISEKPLKLVEVEVKDFKEIMRRFVSPDELESVLNEIVEKAKASGVESLLERARALQRLVKSDVERGVEELARVSSALELEDMLRRSLNAASEAEMIARIVEDIVGGARETVADALKTVYELREAVRRSALLLEQLEKIKVAREVLGRSYERVVRELRELIERDPLRAEEELREIFERVRGVESGFDEAVKALIEELGSRSPELAKYAERIARELRREIEKGEISVEEAITELERRLLSKATVDTVGDVLSALRDSLERLRNRLARVSIELAKRVEEDARLVASREMLERIRFRVDDLEKIHPKLATLLKLMGKKEVSLLDLIELARELATGGKAVLNLAERLVESGEARTLADAMRMAADIIRASIKTLEDIVKRNAGILREVGVEPGKVITILESAGRAIETIERRLRSPVYERIAELAGVAESLGLRRVAEALRELEVSEPGEMPRLVRRIVDMLREEALKGKIRSVVELLRRFLRGAKKEELPRELRPFVTEMIELARRLSLGEGWWLYSVEIGNAVARGLAVDSAELAARIAEELRPRRVELEIGGERYTVERTVHMEPNRTVIEYKVTAPDGYWAVERIVVDVECGVTGCKPRVARITAIDPRMGIDEALTALDEIYKHVMRDEQLLKHVYVITESGPKTVAWELLSGINELASRIAEMLKDAINKTIKIVPSLGYVLTGIYRLAEKLASASNLEQVIDRIENFKTTINGINVVVSPYGKGFNITFSKDDSYIRILIEDGKAIVEYGGDRHKLIDILRTKIDGSTIAEILEEIRRRFGIPVPMLRPELPKPSIVVLSAETIPIREIKTNIGGLALNIVASRLRYYNIETNAITIPSPRIEYFRIVAEYSRLSGFTVGAPLEMSITIPSPTLPRATPPSRYNPPPLPPPLPSPPPVPPGLIGYAASVSRSGTAVREVIVF